MSALVNTPNAGKEARMSEVDDYLEKEKADRNAWWKLDAGERGNLFDAAVEERDEARTQLAEAQSLLKSIKVSIKILSDHDRIDIFYFSTMLEEIDRFLKGGKG